jgi:hypothetical protein
MPSDVEIVGLESLARLSRAMREAGEQGAGLKRELRSSLTRETKQTRAEIRKAIVPSLPQRGGLAADVLRSTRVTSSLALGQNPGVRIQVRSRRSIRRMNATGAFRHPVFGRRDTWVTQIAGPPSPRFLDKPFEQSRPDLQRAVLGAITRVRAQIYRSV